MEPRWPILLWHIGADLPAAELARLLALNGHPVARHSLGDAAFRWLRHLSGGLELSLSVLLTAEIIGFVYYGALRNGSSSMLLRALCDTFLRDEAAHLVFHIEQLSRMRRSRHRPVLERGGLDFRRFAVRCFERLDFATRLPRDDSRVDEVLAAGAHRAGPGIR